MKIKNDFVTNSSSCSFIMIGFVVPYHKNYEELEDKVKKIGDFYIGYGTEGGAATNDTAIIGEMILKIDEYVEYTEIDLNINNDEIIKLAKEFNVDEKNIKYIVGTRLC